MFFVFLEQIRVVLGMFRGALGVPNFFVASLYARNCIPAIKLLAISKTDELDYFCDFRGRMGVVERVPRYLHRCQFFIASLCSTNSIPTIKLLAISKTAKLEFFCILEKISIVLEVFHGALSVINFFVVSLRARNGIPAIRYC